MMKIKKAPKGTLNPLEPSHCPSGGKISYANPEGWGLGWEVFCEPEIVYNSNGIRTDNSVKPILGLCLDLSLGPNFRRK